MGLANFHSRIFQRNIDIMSQKGGNGYQPKVGLFATDTTDTTHPEREQRIRSRSAQCDSKQSGYSVIAPKRFS